MYQKAILRMFQKAFKITEILFPVLAGKWAVKLFFTPRRFARPKREEEFLRDAHKTKVAFRSDFKMGTNEDYYIRYEWGTVGPAVLLVHGWGGRASQMGQFIKPLLDAGYRVIAFDAIAHGDSPGKRTNMPEFAQIIQAIEEYAGRFHAIIGHSLGGTAAGYAVAEGVQTDRLITICSPSTIEFIFEAFAKQVNASQKTIDRLLRFLVNFSGKKAMDFSFTNFASRISVPGYIIHDRDDKEIPYNQALLLHKNWRDSKLVLTKGLGHRRILRSEDVISKAMDFVKNEQNEIKLRSVSPY